MTQEELNFYGERMAAVLRSITVDEVRYFAARTPIDPEDQDGGTEPGGVNDRASR